MRAGAYLYPWDVDGDPAAADRVAGLGLAGVSLAAAYHAVRAVTPFHPGHRIVTRDAGGVLPARSGPLVRCGAAAGGGRAGRLVRAGRRTAARGRPRRHRLGGAHAQFSAVRGGRSVRGTEPFRRRYPWALCAGSAAVREYAARLAAEVAALDGVDSIELEACGWYGFEHGSAHDKTGDVTGRAGPAGDWLLSLCFCAGCRDAYAGAGADPGKLAALVRAAADGGPALPADAADVLDSTRAAAARRLLGEVTGAVRAAAPGQPVLLHTDPDPRAAGSNPGYDLAVACGPGGVDGVVLACADQARAVGLVTAVGRRRAAGNSGGGQPAGGGRPGRGSADAARAGGRGACGWRYRAALLPRRPGRGQRSGRHPLRAQ